MQQFYRVDKDTGLFVEPVLFDDGIIPVDENIVLMNIPEGFHLPKWDKVNEVWIEGKVSTEILDVIKKTKIAELDAKCNETILAGFTSSALGIVHTYGFSYEDQANLSGALTLMNSIATFPDVQWKTYDSGILPHTKEQFITLCSDSFAHKQSNITRYWTLKGQVEAALTKEDVMLIEW